MMDTERMNACKTPFSLSQPCFDLANQIESIAAQLKEEVDLYEEKVASLRDSVRKNFEEYKTRADAEQDRLARQKTRIDKLFENACHAIGKSNRRLSSRVGARTSQSASKAHARRWFDSHDYFDSQSKRLEVLIKRVAATRFLNKYFSILFYGGMAGCLGAIAWLYRSSPSSPSPIHVIAVAAFYAIYILSLTIGWRVYSNSMEKVEEFIAQSEAEIDESYKHQFESIRTQSERRSAALSAQYNDGLATAGLEFRAKRYALTAQITRLHQELLNAATVLNENTYYADWSAKGWQEWDLATEFPRSVRFGSIALSMPHFKTQFPDLEVPVVPALIDLEDCSIIIDATNSPSTARELAQTAIMRFLATMPPAGVRFTFIDPVSLGGNVAGYMALDSYEPSLVGGKAWSDSRHIEQALVEITDHMETVIQKYLRNTYSSIAQYNADARLKEAYRVVLVFDFPVSFSETAAKRLVSIFRNGPRCGVIPIVLVDKTKPMPHGVKFRDLEQFAVVIAPLVSDYIDEGGY